MTGKEFLGVVVGEGMEMEQSEKRDWVSEVKVVFSFEAETVTRSWRRPARAVIESTASSGEVAAREIRGAVVELLTWMLDVQEAGASEAGSLDAGGPTRDG